MRGVGRELACGASLALAACARPAGTAPITLTFWALGHEGEVVQGLLPAFERTHPGIRVHVEQIPFTAAHEKLLTAVVGRSTPDIAQLGNTWIPEFALLHALAPLDTLVARSPAIDRRDYFDGLWRSNVIDDTTFGLPWYADTRVLFYRSDLLADAEVTRAPRTWSDWRAALQAVRARSHGQRYGIYLPVNEWPQPVILALAAGSPILRDSDQYGDFTDPRFHAAFAFYESLFADSLAPAVSNTEVTNLYEAFGAGTFAMFISGPWDVGECERRLPSALNGRWSTAPMPAPDPVPGVGATQGVLPPASAGTPGASLAGGSTLVIFRGTPHAEAAWTLLQYLSEPAQQAAFYRLSEDLPARRSAWQDAALRGNRYMDAFARQLEVARPTPAVPEWDEITRLLTDQGEAVARGRTSVSTALTTLNREVDAVLERRRITLRAQRTKPAP